jgi:hypothetical protein
MEMEIQWKLIKSVTLGIPCDETEKVGTTCILPFFMDSFVPNVSVICQAVVANATPVW